VERTSRQETVAVPVVPYDRRGGAVAGAVAQQPCAAVRRVEEPLFNGVVGGRAHQAWLPCEEVEGEQRSVVGIPDDGVQPFLFQVPDGDGPRGPTRRHQRHPRPCRQPELLVLP
jgi:hypothetical protein